MYKKAKMKDVVKVLKKRFLVMILTAICITGSIIITSLYLMKPTYQYTIQVLAGSLSMDIEESSINKVQENRQLALSYMDTIKSPQIMIGVKEELKLARSNYELLKQISVTNRDNSQIITISIKDSNPKLAKAIAQSIANQSINSFKGFANVSQINVLLDPNIIEESELLFPKPKFVIAISIVLGIFAGIVLVLIQEHFDDAAFSDAELERLGLSLLGKVHVNTKGKNIRKVRYRTLSLTKRGEHLGY